MLQGMIDTNKMKQITKDQLAYLLNPEQELLSDDYFLLLNDVQEEDATTHPICMSRGILAVS